MNEGDSRNRGIESVSTLIDRLLLPLRNVNSQEEQIQVLETLRLRQPPPLTTTSSNNENNIQRGEEEVEEGETFRHALAVALLNRVVIVAAVVRNDFEDDYCGDKQTQEEDATLRALQETLWERCGVSVSLSAAMHVISRTATTTTTSTSSRNDTVAFDAALQILASILLRSPDRLRILIHELLEAPVTEDGGAYSLPSSSSSSFLSTWTGQVVLFSRVIANRCRDLQQSLPKWAVAANWEARLVECACLCCIRTIGTSDKQLQEQRHHHYQQQQHEDRYLQCLLSFLLSRQGGESVALGVYRAWKTTNHTTTAITAADHTVTATISSRVVGILQDSNDIPPTKVASFCRGLLLLALSQQKRSDTKDGQATSAGKTTGIVVPTWLSEFCLPLLSSSRLVQDSLVQQTILSSTTTPRQASWIANLLHLVDTREDDHVHHKKDIDEGDDSSTSSNSDDSSATTVSSTKCLALLRQVRRVAPLWSSTGSRNQYRKSAAATTTTEEHLHAVTEFLQCALELLFVQLPPTTVATAAATTVVSTRRLNATSTTTHILIQGVSERLHSTNPNIRRDGMLIGELLGRHLLGNKSESCDDDDGQTPPIIFDELHRREEEVQQPEGKKKEHVQRLQRKRLIQKSRRKTRPLQTDPDAPYETESDSESETSSLADDSGRFSDDSDWYDEQNGDTKFGAYCYDVQDDEQDLRLTPLPLYLQDCLDLLRTPETEELACSRHEAALEALPSLVRARPSDLTDFGPLLAKQLVCIENKFGLDKFEEKILEPLCALAAEEPLVVGHALIEDLFHRDGSLYNRMLALTALNEAAWEVSGSKRLQESFTRANSKLPPLEGPRVFGKRELVAEEPHEGLIASGKTRRWGRARTGDETSVFTNRFSSIAPSWFYSLVGKFWERLEDSSLWSGHAGSLLLARFIQTLAVIVESCGPYDSGTHLLAQDLFELVWRFRDAEVAEVRSSVLCAVGTCLSLMPEESLLRLVIDTSPAVDLPRYIQSTSSSDQDHHCRDLARRIEALISNNIRAIGV